MRDSWKRVWNILSTALVVLVVLCAVFLMGLRLFGFQPYTVITGSMTPVYKVGDLIFVKEIYDKDFNGISDPVELAKAKQEKIKRVQALVDDGTLKVGDDITFVKDEKLTVATHRIVKIDSKEQTIVTQGLTNNDTDAPISYLNVIGEVKFSLPALGKVSSFIQNPPGMYITLALGVVLILLVFLPDMIVRKKKDEKNAIDPVLQSEMDAAAEENKQLKEQIALLRAQAEKKDRDRE